MSPIPHPMRYKTIIINRIQDTDRLEHMLKVCQKLKIEPTIFSAVSSDDLTIIDSNLLNIKFVKFGGEMYLHDITKSDYPITTGMMGACISYREIYAKLLQDAEYDAYIILEDDINISEFCRYPTLDEFVQTLPNVSMYDIAFLDVPRYLQVKPENEYSAKAEYSRGIENEYSASTEYSRSIENESFVEEKISHDYVQYSKITFGRNYTQIITKRAATKYISYFRNFIYKSPEDSLCIACNHLFTNIILPKYPIFTYTDDWESRRKPLSIEWYSQEYINTHQPRIINEEKGYARKIVDTVDRFYLPESDDYTNNTNFHAFWINVDGQTDRENFMIRELNFHNIPHTRVTAFTPSTLPELQITPNCYVSNLEYACMCSHVKAYETGLSETDDSVQWFLILEDDMIIYENRELINNINVSESLKSIIASRPKDAECLQLFCSNPDVQKISVKASIAGEEWVPINNTFWGACAYFISRRAARKNFNRYTISHNRQHSGDPFAGISKIELKIDFTMLQHPINPEGVAYSQLKTYSHTKSIFTTREDIGSIVHQSHVPDHFYCNFVVRERLNYASYHLNPHARDICEFENCSVLSDKPKVFTFILSANSKTSGAYELADILNNDPYHYFETESYPQLPWVVDMYKFKEKIKQLSERDYPRVGDVGGYYINYVEYILTEIKNESFASAELLRYIKSIKFVYIDSDVKESVDDYINTTPMQHYWCKKDTYQNTYSQKGAYIPSSFDECYPKYMGYDDPIIFLTKSDCAEQYCLEYKRLAESLQKNYPNNFKIFGKCTGNKYEWLSDIYNFLGCPQRAIR